MLLRSIEIYIYNQYTNRCNLIRISMKYLSYKMPHQVTNVKYNTYLRINIQSKQKYIKITNN